MKPNSGIFKDLSAGRLLSVLLMLFCLTFLTTANFFFYGSPDAELLTEQSAGAEESDADYPPSGPTEEKSSTSPVSFSEEILHEAHPEFNFKASNQFYLHFIAEAERIEMFHPERVLPPPKF